MGGAPFPTASLLALGQAKPVLPYRQAQKQWMRPWTPRAVPLRKWLVGGRGAIQLGLGCGCAPAVCISGCF